MPIGDLFSAGFQGSGERWADNVAIMGARLKKGNPNWSDPFVMADVPGFPDINPMMFIDSRRKLWLMWYTVLANQWSSSLPKYRISSAFEGDDGTIHVVYSFHRKDLEPGNTIKWVSFPADWLKE